MRQIDPTRRKLTELQCKNAKIRVDEQGNAKTTKFTDGYGLVLELLPGARGTRKHWTVSFRLDNKQRKLFIGTYPEVSLAEARRMHEEAWQLVRVGEDPRLATITDAQKRAAAKERRALEAEQQAIEEAKAETTFEAVALRWFDNMADKISAKTRRTRLSLLTKEIFPAFGSKQIDEITITDIQNALEPIAERGATFQAKRTREILSAIFNNARALQLCEANPADALKHVGALKGHKSEHYKSLEFRQMGPLMRSLRDPDSARLSEGRFALELLILTVVRPQNARLARWENFHDLDTDEPVWILPGEQMKQGKDHVVPLSRQAVNLLLQVEAFDLDDVYLFPGTKAQGISDATLKRALDLLGYGPERCVPHGFRSTFRTHAGESGKWSEDAMEMSLAHSDKNQVRAAYNRGAYLAERRRLLQWWADELDRICEASAALHPQGRL